MVDLVELDAADLKLVLSLLKEHELRTKSPLATRLIADWATKSKQFIKVYPREYRRVIEERAKKVAASAGVAATA